MKKITLAVMALALASFATLSAQTITKNIRLNDAVDDYGPDGYGGAWSVKNTTRLGNYYYIILAV